MIGWTLGRYFFTRYVQITFYFLLGIFALSMLLDFTENASKLSNLPDYTVWAALGISAMRVPFIMQQMIPFVALFSAMATLISLNRKYELVVARRRAAIRCRNNFRAQSASRLWFLQG
jgi:lipopolysaccharide export system permease protein